MIQGNTDLMIADYNDELYRTLKEKAPVMAEALKSDAQLLNPVEKEFLKNLPIQKKLRQEGLNSCLYTVHRERTMKTFFRILR